MFKPCWDNYMQITPETCIVRALDAAVQSQIYTTINVYYRSLLYLPHAERFVEKEGHQHSTPKRLYGSLPAHADISAAEFHHFFDKKVDHIGSSYVNAPVPVYTRYALQLFISGFPISRSHEVMAAVFITTLMSLTFVAYTKTSITGRRSFRTTQPSTLRGTVK